MYLYPVAHRTRLTFIDRAISCAFKCYCQHRLILQEMAGACVHCPPKVFSPCHYGSLKGGGPIFTSVFQNRPVPPDNALSPTPFTPGTCFIVDLHWESSVDPRSLSRRHLERRCWTCCFIQGQRLYHDHDPTSSRARPMTPSPEVLTPHTTRNAVQTAEAWSRNTYVG